MLVPVILANQNLGDAWLFPGEHFAVEGDVLITLLAPHVDASVLDRLKALRQTQSSPALLTEEAIRQTGLKTRFDTAMLELHVTIPASLRSTNVVYLSRQGEPPVISDLQSPSTLSGYINVFGSQPFHANQNDAANGRQPLRSDFESAINFKNWVLESNATFLENATRELSRGDVRLLRDDPKNMIRYAVGDLAYPVSGYQRFRPMAGVTVARNFTLQPYRVTQPMSNTELVLESPSRIDVYVNGSRSQTLHLPAGRHDLRNLALGNGISDVRLDITDSAGRRQSVTFPWISSTDLLASGLHQFAYSVGVPSTTFNELRKYDETKPTASFFHRYGVSDKATLGTYFQGNKSQILVGVEAIRAGRLGILSLEPALSRVSGNAINYAARLRYSYIDYRGPRGTQRHITLGAEYRQARFALIDELTPFVTPAYDLSASYGQQVALGINARVSGNYQFNRDGNTSLYDSYGAGISLLRNWNNGIQFNLTFNDRKNQLGIRERGVFALLSWAIPGTNHYLTATSDSIRESNRLDWRYNSSRLSGGYNALVGVEKAEELNRADVLFDYFGNRGSVGINHVTQESKYTRATHDTTLRMSGALVFAGGVFGMGRTVNDSFALVAPKGSLSSQTIEINPNSYEHYDARADWLGPGVVSNIRSYQYYHLHFDPSRLEPGYELGRENFALRPTYKSGTLIRPGTDATVMLDGTLVDRQGKPVALEGAEARYVGTPDSKPIVLFTNRKGRFRMEGFRPGTWEIQFYGGKWRPLRIVIPASAHGIHQAGTVKVDSVE